MPFNLGPFEMIMVMLVLLLVFGAKRLPELGSGLGKGIREFRRSMKEISADIERPEETEKIAAPQRRPTVAPPVESHATDEPRN